MHGSGDNAVAQSQIYFLSPCPVFRVAKAIIATGFTRQAFFTFVINFPCFIYDLLVRGRDGSSDPFQISPMHILWGSQSIWIESAEAASADGQFDHPSWLPHLSFCWFRQNDMHILSSGTVSMSAATVIHIIFLSGNLYS